MGCAASQPTGGKRAVDAFDLIDDAAGSTAGNGDKKAKAGRRSIFSSSQSRTSSGYHSDVGEERVSQRTFLIAEHKGQNVAKDLHAKYDTSNAVVIGRGTQGRIIAVRHRATNELFAVKIVNLQSFGGSISDLEAELTTHKKLDHPNIAKIFETYLDDENGECAIVMEMCTGGSLVRRLSKQTTKHFDEVAAATLVEKMLSAVIYCHHHGVVVRAQSKGSSLARTRCARHARDSLEKKILRSTLRGPAVGGSTATSSSTTLCTRARPTTPRSR